MIRIAILDDYQNVALEMADWSPLAGRADITVFNDHLSNLDEIVDRLLPFDVVCLMRERTPLPRAVIERLPRLKLIASTGPRNAAIDVEAAGRARYRGNVYGIRCTPHHRDDLGSHPCERASGRIGKGKHTGKEPNRLR
jgi:phosphoglycerate dehydrogenase-like enzyme